MTHQHHKPGRTTHSELESVPPPKHSDDHKKAIMFLGVFLVMVVMGTLYVASFKTFGLSGNKGEVPRWSQLQSEMVEYAKPLTEEFFSLKNTFSRLIRARAVQAESIDLVAKKIKEANEKEKEAETEAATSTEEIPIEEEIRMILKENN